MTVLSKLAKKFTKWTASFDPIGYDVQVKELILYQKTSNNSIVFIYAASNGNVLLNQGIGCYIKLHDGSHFKSTDDGRWVDIENIIKKPFLNAYLNFQYNSAINLGQKIEDNWYDNYRAKMESRKVRIFNGLGIADYPIPKRPAYL